ncbi:MAG TPA: NIPSNAP family protein [Sphingomonas sp.]
MMDAPQDYYELRLYQCVPGRLPDLHHRMGYELPPLFARHGVTRPLAYWDGFGGVFNPLYAYILKWQSLDDRFRAFGGFYSDPDWITHRDASNAGQQMIERLDLMILRPSPHWEKLKTPGEPVAVGGLHELRLQRLSTRNAAEAHRVLAEVELPYLRDRGATILGVFMVWYGWQTPQAVILLAWPDIDTRQHAMTEFDADPEIRAMRKVERERFGGPLLGSADTHLMRPADYGVARSNLSPLP